eukprot:13054660-Alexandrium_andersonii.AAC.1
MDGPHLRELHSARHLLCSSASPLLIMTSRITATASSGGFLRVPSLCHPPVRAGHPRPPWIMS